MLVKTIPGQEATETINFVLEMCCACGIPFMMPLYHKKMLLADRSKSFYCPNGHGQHYIGKTEAEKLKEKLEQLEKEKDELREDLQNRWLDTLNEKNKLEKQLKRVHKGVCPCCNRSFSNLERHMKSKHPEAVAK